MKREISDINIWSHIFMIPPLIYHIYQETFFMSGYTIVMIILSYKYHRSYEKQFIFTENTLGKIFCLCMTYRCIFIPRSSLIHFLQGISASSTIWIFIIGHYNYKYHYLIHISLSIWGILS